MNLRLRNVRTENQIEEFTVRAIKCKSQYKFLNAYVAMSLDSQVRY